MGAVPMPGRSAAGVPETPGPNAVGADNLPIETLPSNAIAAYVLDLARNPTSNAGPVDLSCPTNGTLIMTYDILAATAALAANGVEIMYGTIAWPSLLTIADGASYSAVNNASLTSVSISKKLSRYSSSYG